MSVLNTRGDSTTDTLSQNFITQEIETLEHKVDDLQTGKVSYHDLQSYATTDYVDSLATFNEKSTELFTKVYATKTDVARAIAQIPIYDDTEIVDRIIELENIDHSQYLTEHQDLSEYAKKTDIVPAFDDTDIKSRLDNLESIDHSKYLTEHQDLSKYALLSDIKPAYDDTALSHRISILENKQDDYLTEHQSLKEYAKLTDIPLEYDDSKIVARLTALENKPVIDYSYDDTEIRRKLNELEIRQPDHTDYYTKAETISLLDDQADYFNEQITDITEFDSDLDNRLNWLEIKEETYRPLNGFIWQHGYRNREGELIDENFYHIIINADKLNSRTFTYFLSKQWHDLTPKECCAYTGYPGPDTFYRVLDEVVYNAEAELTLTEDIKYIILNVFPDRYYNDNRSWVDATYKIDIFTNDDRLRQCEEFMYENYQARKIALDVSARLDAYMEITDARLADHDAHFIEVDRRLDWIEANFDNYYTKVEVDAQHKVLNDRLVIVEDELEGATEILNQILHN